MAVTLFLYLLCLALWLGGMVFFSAFVAPILFTRLPEAQAGAVVNAVFPRYYMLGYVAGVIALILAIYFVAARGPRGWWSLAAIALAAALALTVYAGAVVRPRIEVVRPAVEEANPEPARKAEFDRLHHLSVMINGAVLALDLLALAASTAALSPRV